MMVLFNFYVIICVAWIIISPRRNTHETSADAAIECLFVMIYIYIFFILYGYVNDFTYGYVKPLVNLLLMVAFGIIISWHYKKPEKQKVKLLQEQIKFLRQNKEGQILMANDKLKFLLSKKDKKAIHLLEAINNYKEQDTDSYKKAFNPIEITIMEHIGND